MLRSSPAALWPGAACAIRDARAALAPERAPPRQGRLSQGGAAGIWDCRVQIAHICVASCATGRAVTVGRRRGEFLRGTRVENVEALPTCPGCSRLRIRACVAGAGARVTNLKPCGAYYIFTIFFGRDQERPPPLNPRPASLQPCPSPSLQCCCACVPRCQAGLHVSSAARSASFGPAVGRRRRRRLFRRHHCRRRRRRQQSAAAIDAHDAIATGAAAIAPPQPSPPASRRRRPRCLPCRDCRHV